MMKNEENKRKAGEINKKTRSKVTIREERNAESESKSEDII